MTRNNANGYDFLCTTNYLVNKEILHKIARKE